MPQSRDILDAPGTLPGEEPETLPATVQAFCDLYDVGILDHEDGTTPMVRVSPAVYADVHRRAREANDLRASRVSTGNGCLFLVAVVDVGDSAVTMTATAHANVLRTVIELVDL